MKSIKLLFLAVTCLTVNVFGQNQKTIKQQEANKEISFIEGSLASAMKVAKAENKLIFVDAFTTWCGPCKQLQATTFKDKTAADYFNKNFVNLAVDMEKGEGPVLSSKWVVEGYPTLLILDKTGKPISRLEGYAPAKELIAFAEEVLKKK